MEETTTTNESAPKAPESLDLEARVQYLEAQNEGLKRVGILALILIFVLGGLFVFQVWTDLKGIATGGIVLHDDKRDGRVALTVSPQGSLALVPINPLGGAPVLEQAEGQVQGLTLYDSAGRLRIIIGMNLDDQPVVVIFDPNGRPVWTPMMAAGKAPAASPTPGKPGAATPKSATPSPAVTSPGTASPAAVTPTPVALPSTPAVSPTPAATPH